MHPHTPSDRRAFETPEFGATETPTTRSDSTRRTPSTAWAMLVALLILAAIIAVTVLL